MKPTYKFTKKEILKHAIGINKIFYGKEYGVTKKEAEKEFVKGWRESANARKPHQKHKQSKLHDIGGGYIMSEDELGIGRVWD